MENLILSYERGKCLKKLVTKFSDIQIEKFVNNLDKVYGLPTRSDSPTFETHAGNAMKSKNVSGRLCALWTKGIREIKSGRRVKVSKKNFEKTTRK